MPNNIPQLQNSDRSLRLLVTQRNLYGWAKTVSVIQIILVVALPGILLIIDHLSPACSTWSAFAGVLIAVLDTAAINPIKEHMTEKGAAVQELFDCEVLGLEWPELVTSKPDREDIAINASPKEVSLLKDWYPVIVGGLPHAVGRIICQRSNCWWDGKLRRFYGGGITAFWFVVLVLVGLIAIEEHLTFENFMVSLLTPVLPLILWGIREVRLQREAADRSDRLKSFGDQLWGQVMQHTLNDDAMRVQSRKFQDEIFQRRSRSPLVFNWFYFLFRNRFESQMQNSAADMAEQARSAGW
jgi:hypothetical protein